MTLGSTVGNMSWSSATLGFGWGAGVVVTGAAGAGAPAGGAYLGAEDGGGGGEVVVGMAGGLAILIASYCEVGDGVLGVLVQVTFEAVPRICFRAD